ncbi:MAG: glucokinase, partial [Roseobacter sp.]
MPDHAPRCFLVADVGGTNTRVALSDGAVVRTDTIRRYRNADQVGLEPVLTDFVTRLDGAATLQGACV